MNKTILVVDDDRLNLTLLQIGLKHKDYEVLTAQNGKEAIEVVKGRPVDAIVLDIQMPQMNGYEFIKELQMMPQGRIPVIILTASETMQDVFFMEGVRGYLVKPVNLELLDQKIRSALA